MRYKTSLYIDESVDRSSDQRAAQKGTSKSRVIECDIQRFQLCIDIGARMAQTSLSEEERADIMNACTYLTGEAAKANFLISGVARSILDKGLQKKASEISVLERLALLDEAERSN